MNRFVSREVSNGVSARLAVRLGAGVLAFGALAGCGTEAGAFAPVLSAGQGSRVLPPVSQDKTSRLNGVLPGFTPTDPSEFIMSEALHSTVLKYDTEVLCPEVVKGNEYQMGHAYVSVGVGEGNISRVQLKRYYCDVFSDVMQSGGSPEVPHDFYVAALSATHEAEHINDILDHGTIQYDEAETQCLAFQKLPQLLEHAGIDTESSDTARVAATSAYFQIFAAEYITPDCYENGPYDLDLEQPGWFPYPSNAA